MREVMLDGEPVRIHGSMLTAIVYRDAFSRVDAKSGQRIRADIVGDLIEVMVENSLLLLQQVLWAMAQTAKTPPNSLPGFGIWLSQHEESLMDFGDQALWKPVVEEAKRAFFRGAATAKPTETPRLDKV
jgi:hypothetical protein